MSQCPPEWASPTAEQLHDAIDSATAAMSAQRQSGSIAGGKVCGALCEIPEVNDLMVISDLHGDHDSLARILSEVGYEDFLSDSRNKMVFLGDYVDRGINSIGVLYSVCQLKTAFPESVVLMRGNHEAPSEFPFSSHDFPFQLADQFGESIGRTIYRKSLLLFRQLTVATIAGAKILLVHGGLPTEETVLQDYRGQLSLAQENYMRNKVLEEILWNDPREIDAFPGWERSRRGLGRHFGANVTEKWLGVSGARCVVRGHEPCQGARIDHGGRIMTLFTSKAPYPSFKAAYISVKQADLQLLRDARDLVPLVRYLE